MRRRGGDLLLGHVGVEVDGVLVDRTVSIHGDGQDMTLANAALVVAPYTVDGERAGSIGVLGPARMDYREAMAAVAAVSNRLETRLIEG